MERLSYNKFLSGKRQFPLFFYVNILKTAVEFFILFIINPYFIAIDTIF